VGCVADDEELYEVFADLFDPIIEERHNVFTKNDKHVHHVQVVFIASMQINVRKAGWMEWLDGWSVLVSRTSKNGQKQ